VKSEGFVNAKKRLKNKCCFSAWRRYRLETGGGQSKAKIKGQNWNPWKSNIKPVLLFSDVYWISNYPSSRI